MIKLGSPMPRPSAGTPSQPRPSAVGSVVVCLLAIEGSPAVGALSGPVAGVKEAGQRPSALHGARPAPWCAASRGARPFTPAPRVHYRGCDQPRGCEEWIATTRARPDTPSAPRPRRLSSSKCLHGSRMHHTVTHVLETGALSRPRPPGGGPQRRPRRLQHRPGVSLLYQRRGFKSAPHVVLCLPLLHRHRRHTNDANYFGRTSPCWSARTGR